MRACVDRPDGFASCLLPELYVDTYLTAPTFCKDKMGAGFAEYASRFLLRGPSPLNATSFTSWWSAFFQKRSPCGEQTVARLDMGRWRNSKWPVASNLRPG